MAERKPSDDKAAFGVFPQMKPKRSKQDREAAKNIPVDVARGFAAGALGMPGDVESLIRMLPGLDEQTILPTSEDILKRIPFGSDTPAGKAASGLGILGGGFYTGPGSAARAITAVPKAVKRAGLDFVESMSPVHVVKPSGKGANWLDGQRGSVEAQLNRLKMGDTSTPEWYADRSHYLKEAKAKGDERAIRAIEYDVDVAKRNDAMNAWIQGNLRNYVKNQMATPDDPIRKLAEEGILHMAPYGEQGVVSSRLMNKRMGLGQDPLGMGRSDPARFWERMSDISVDAYPAGSYKHGSLDESLLVDNPWLQKVPDETMVYSGKGISGDLGFDHVLDVLREDLTAGRIRPEQLNKVSMEQAVRRTYEYDQELAKKMRETALKQQEGFPVYKEYPEGYRWIELKQPEITADSLPSGYEMQTYKNNNGGTYYSLRDMNDGGVEVGAGMSPELAIKSAGKKIEDPRLEEALKYEGDTMGHCVGGYCPDVMEGKSRIYSLRDAKGEPHVTVEVKPNQHLNFNSWWEKQPQELRDAINARARRGEHNSSIFEAPEYLAARDAQPPIIKQIKGKQNRAPKAEYLPYVQDFVKSGTYSEVGDLQNTGLYKLDKDFLGNAASNLPRGERSGMFLPHEREELILKAMESKLLPERGYITEQEYEDALRAVAGPPTPGPTMELLREMAGMPPEGMKRGGVVVSKNPDTMMLEVNNKRMAGGGIISKLAKLARAPAKSKAEIEVIAERMAPQMLGEFVRGEKGTKSVADKTQKQFAKEKDMTADVRPTKGQGKAPKAVSIEELKDQVMIGIPGDPTIANKTLYGINDMRLDSPSPQHGGPLYGLENEGDAFWASGLGAANRVQNLAREAGQQYDLPVLGNYIMMGPESINYAQHFADANLSAINPAKMSKGQIEAFNNMVREGFPYVKNKERFQRVFPAFPGIENPSEAYLHFAIDPELRKHFNALMQMPTVTEKYNLPSGTDVRFAITEPDLRNLETGVTGKSIGRMRPEVEDLNLSSHPTYSHDIPGEFLGSSNYPMPYELSFPDTVKAVRENPKQAPHEFGSLKMIGPRQVIDQQMIDEIRQYEEMIKKMTGMAAGGVVKSLAKTEALANLAKLREEMAAKAEAVKNLVAKDENKYLRDVTPNSLTNAEIEAEIARMKARGQPEVKKAEGGAIDYNTTPDMSDGGRIMEGAPFKRGGKVSKTPSRDMMFLELSNKKLKRK